MTKTQPPSTIHIDDVGEFSTNAVPDPFDERDLIYRPRLARLEERIDKRDIDKKDLLVLRQIGNSCTGHAVASLIYTVIRCQVSPYMLYYYARRYDSFEGEEDIGSSLRGAFKGWFYHGIAVQEDWPDLEPPFDFDLESPKFIRKCRERPLGAFYRINPYRLDDMQSAINELGAVAVSAAVHDGWKNPIFMHRGKDVMHLIARPVNAKALGGHAFALVGYNEVGFLVQNSWSTNWGKGGYATLPYEDWLENAYDAWVARPGVPQTPFYGGHTQNFKATGGTLAISPGPDLKRLARHVINLGNNGQLSQSGQFISTPRQIEGIFQNMERWHNFWLEQAASPPRHIVLFAHGGMVTESNGLQSAQEHLNWWLNNQTYPVYFVWETGPKETFFNHVHDLAKNKLPFGTIGFDLMEQVDRWIEKKIAPLARWLWEEIKQNARAASGPIESLGEINWQLDGSGRLDPDAEKGMQTMPGASLVVTRLAEYIARHGSDNVKIHLVGHSAGTIFHASMLERLAEAGIQVDSLTFLAPALRVDEFRSKVLPKLGPQRTVNRFTNFVLSDSRELEDSVLPQPGPALYHKSILYLLARGAEFPSGNTAVRREARPYEVPMLGMERFLKQPLSDLFGAEFGKTNLWEEIESVKGQVILSPSLETEADSRSDATMHTDFETNSVTMASVMMRIQNVKEVVPQYNYPANTPLYLIDDDGAPIIDESQNQKAQLLQTLETKMPGESPLTEVSQPQTQAPEAPPPTEPGPTPEVAVAPRSGIPVVDILQAEGWRRGPAPSSK